MASNIETYEIHPRILQALARQSDKETFLTALISKSQRAIDKIM